MSGWPLIEEAEAVARSCCPSLPKSPEREGDSIPAYLQVGDTTAASLPGFTVTVADLCFRHDAALLFPRP
jgi:hypothetical protein